MINAQKIFFFLIGALLVYSCIKEPDYPNEPVIEFSKIIQTNTPSVDEVIVEVTFQDGDGDLGLAANEVDSYPDYGEYLVDEFGNILIDEATGDSIPNPFFFNYFIDIWKMGADGQYALVNLPDGVSFNGRYPILNELMNETALEGELRYQIDILYGGGSPISRGDVIKFKVQIADRAKQLSNEVWTDSVIVGEPQVPSVNTGG
ncbi:hypothetical protein R9C00_19800 [Flammeovirgaceae bacterium SG7u.111]|nr:hypothetical protein [Flammeovirgaceae bacterium SG7u.132]WPO33946.1 hypothetical protein R9C00_19800 [Flammeovirgaceae bacterium SG7u.111]